MTFRLYPELLGLSGSEYVRAFSFVVHLRYAVQKLLSVVKPS